MIFNPTPLKGSFVIELSPVTDSRGWFARAFCKNEFSEIGHVKEWVQINHSFTKARGTLRGMHFQIPPCEEIKLVRCITGSVYDVIIDIRKNSQSYLKWFSTELSASNKKMIYIPEGFAHGFQTLTENSELIYHHSEFYTPGSEKGIMFNDPAINIKWPLPISDISEKDKNHPAFPSILK